MGAFYDTLLDLVFYFPCGGEKRFRRKCLDFAIPLKGENILDVCCGTGSFSYLIASRVGFEGQVIGLDLCKTRCYWWFFNQTI
jgi:demethylmenaquinone methyltransferase/2-methoxy-6-polyprenyl-1,4-benzoquinol methylase